MVPGGGGGWLHVVADEGAEADAAFVGEVVGGEGDVVADAADGLGDGGGIGGVYGWGDGVGAVGAHVVAGKVEGDRAGDQDVDRVGGLVVKCQLRLGAVAAPALLTCFSVATGSFFISGTKVDWEGI